MHKIARNNYLNASILNHSLIHEIYRLKNNIFNHEKLAYMQFLTDKITSSLVTAITAFSK